MYFPVYASPSCTLRRFIDDVVHATLAFPSEATVQDGERLLFDPDFDDNLDRTFGELSLHPGKMITVTDEDEEFMPVVFIVSRWVLAGIASLRSVLTCAGSPVAKDQILQAADITKPIPSRPPKAPSAQAQEGPAIGAKRKAIDDVGAVPAAKKARQEIVIADDDGPITLDD